MPKNKGGRPEIKIDWDEFDKLCALHCTECEIAEWFGCTDDTIQKHVKKKHGLSFSEYYKKKSSKGKVSLRRKQYEVALKGSVPMLIWCGKQILGQKDKSELSGPEGEALSLTVNFIKPDNG